MTDRVVVPLPDDTPFPIENLPLGIGATVAGAPARAWVALGDDAVDLAGLQQSGLLGGLGLPYGCFGEESLNRYLGAGPEVWAATRGRLTEVLSEPVQADLFRSRDSLVMEVPVQPTDFVDFYSSLHHATNLGRIFRPDGEPLLPNWRYLPVGYHGRTGTLVPDRSPVVRPCGLRLVDGRPEFGPTAALDIELEVGTVVGIGNRLGQPILASDAGDHLYGMCLINDWSARDIQAFEYQPLGPFLGKSFATSVSPWLVSFEALADARVAAPVQEPPPADHLRTSRDWGFELHLEVLLQSSAMRAAGIEPLVVSRTGFADMYWTPAQQLAHLTANGARTSAGDLFGSGTVSGPDVGTEGSLIELTSNGTAPLELPDGTERTFLLDGDTVTLRGWAGGADGRPRIGLSEVTGTITPAAGD